MWKPPPFSRGSRPFKAGETRPSPKNLSSRTLVPALRGHNHILYVEAPDFQSGEPAFQGRRNTPAPKNLSSRTLMPAPAGTRREGSAFASFLGHAFNRAVHSLLHATARCLLPPPHCSSACGNDFKNSTKSAFSEAESPKWKQLS